MKRPPKDDLARQLQNAQMAIVERALIGFVEEIDGKIPTDKVILREGVHAAFSASPLSVYEKDNKRFSQFYIWRDEHVLALGFLDTNDLLCLYVAEVPSDEWPVALKLWMSQRRGET